jgi:hypothetical protein
VFHSQSQGMARCEALEKLNTPRLHGRLPLAGAAEPNMTRVHGHDGHAEELKPDSCLSARSGNMLVVSTSAMRTFAWITEAGERSLFILRFKFRWITHHCCISGRHASFDLPRSEPSLSIQLDAGHELGKQLRASLTKYRQD